MWDPVELADAVTQAAITRVARFHVTNEFGDWDRALHTLSFANAVRGGLARSGSRELVRGVYDAAMSVYLDRFLNVPPARLPKTNGQAPGPDLLEQLPNLLDRQQRVDEAAKLVVDYRASGAPVADLLEAVGGGLLREDRNFHTIQAVEAQHPPRRIDRRAGGRHPGPRGRRPLSRGARAHRPFPRSNVSDRPTLATRRTLVRGGVCLTAPDPEGVVAVFHGIREPFTFLSYPIPEPEAGAVVLKMRLANICGSDLHYWRGDADLVGRGFEMPYALGHEGVGEIFRLGQGVTTDSSAQPVRPRATVSSSATSTPAAAVPSVSATTPTLAPTGSASGCAAFATGRTSAAPSRSTTTCIRDTPCSGCLTGSPTRPWPA